MYTGPQIVTSGLVMHLDAANLKSYSGTGSTWYDRSRNLYNCSLFNAPTFTTENLGTLNFDGTNDYGALSLSFSQQIATLTEITMITWVNISSIDYANVVLGLSLAANGTTGFWMSNNPTQGLYFTFRRPFVNSTSTAYYGPISTIGNKWVMLVGRSNSTSTKADLYDGGNPTTREQTGQVALGNLDTSYSFVIANKTQTPGVTGTNLHMGISQIYNRYLTDSEVLQNFNATRSRFGI